MRRVTRHFRDPFPAISHWGGALLGVAGLVVLVASAGTRPWALGASVVYGLCLVALFSASAVYHTALCSEEEAERLVRLDYTAIYLLIAGTYTPVCLLGVRGGWGWGMLIGEWTMAGVGIALVFAVKGCPELVRVLLYVAMGWLVVVAVGPTLRGLTGAEFGWLLAGGVVYTLGAVVYATKRPRLWPGRFDNHDLWHTMVLAGAACHFVTVRSMVAG